MIKKKITDYGFIDLRLNGSDFSKGESVSGQVYIGLDREFPGTEVVLKIIGRERFSMNMIPSKKFNSKY